MADDSLSRAGYYAFGSSMCFILVLGLALQTTTWRALTHKESKRFELTPYYKNMVVFSALLLLTSVPTTMTNAFKEGYHLSRGSCDATGFLAGVGSVGTMVTMACITVKIYLKMTRYPFQNNGQIHRRGENNKVLAFVWLYSVGIMLPPLTGWSSFAYEAVDTNCAPNWRPTTRADVAYVLFITVLAFFVPLVVSCTYLLKIYRQTRQISPENSLAYTLRLKTDLLRVTKMVASGIFVFVLSWTPYCICVFISLLGYQDIFHSGASVAPAFFAKASVLYNPILCLIFSRR